MKLPSLKHIFKKDFKNRKSILRFFFYKKIYLRIFTAIYTFITIPRYFFIILRCFLNNQNKITYLDLRNETI